MKDWPTDAMRQHDRVIAALCDDWLETGVVSLDGPKTTRVVEINRQINSTREDGLSESGRQQ